MSTPDPDAPAPTPASSADPGLPAPSPLFRPLALLASLAFVGLTLSPALRDPPRDSFPLSTYPMFSTVRGPSWIHVVVGYDAQGEEHRIPPQLVANFEVMQAAQTIRRAVRAKRAKQLCAEVAARVVTDTDFAALVYLEVQSRRFDPARYFTTEDGQTPLEQRRRARCKLAPYREAQS